MAKEGKRLRLAQEQIDRVRRYSLEEALKLLKSLPPTRFDQTVEIAANLGVDTRHGDQAVRGTVVLPHGTGKVPKVAVFATGETAREALAAGADTVGAEDLVEKIEAGWDDFDILVATPDLMRIVGRLGKKLGPRMPSKKAGNITQDAAGAVRELKSGKVEFRADRGGVVHVPIGKLSFDDQQLRDNFVTLLSELIRSKPSTAKGQYLKALTLSSTMSPGIKLNLQEVQQLAETH